MEVAAVARVPEFPYMTPVRLPNIGALVKVWVPAHVLEVVVPKARLMFGFVPPEEITGYVPVTLATPPEEVVVAMTFPFASTARRVPAAVPSFGRKRSPIEPPAVAAPITRFPPPIESIAYGEVVPMPTFPSTIRPFVGAAKL